MTGDGNGNVYITSNALRKVSGGTTIMTTLAGGVSCGASTTALGDGGPPTSACLSTPGQIAIDLLGSVLVADSGNNKIRKLYDWTPTSQPSTQPSVQPSRQPSIQPSIQPSM